MLNLQQLLQAPVIDFDSHTEDFVWDHFFHTPVMTPKFVMNKIGTDLVAYAGSEIQAQRMLNTLAKVAKDYLFSNLPMTARDYQEFRLSRELDTLQNYLEYQMAFVIAATTTGSVYELYNLTNHKDKKVSEGLEMARSNARTKFQTRFFERIPERLLRVGY